MNLRLTFAISLGMALFFTQLCVFAETPDRLKIEFPKVGEYEVLCGDFHMHTVNSDGKPTPEERVREAWRHGYDVIAIADHAQCPDFSKSYEQALPAARELGLLLIEGFESGVDNKEHFVVLGMGRDYPARDDHQWAEQPGQRRAYYQDRLRLIADAGGWVFHPHPHVGFREPLKWAIEQGIIQGIEVKNEVAGQFVATVKNNGVWWYAFGFDWALEHNLTIFANTDAHDPRSEGPQPYTLILAKDRSEQGVMEAIKARRTAAWFDGLLVGRKALVTDLVNSMVDVSLRKVGSGSEVRVINRGPIALKATVMDRAGWSADIELPAHGEVNVTRNASADVLMFYWKNVLTSSRDKLLTSYDLR